MPKEQPALVAKELSRRTWPDFERLFRRPGEWRLCMCMYYHRPRPTPKQQRPRSETGIARRNLREHKAMMEGGRAHGTLVYAGVEPVGWCQYGPKEELPRIDGGRKYRKLALATHGRLWRITCFCVDRRYRNRAVANFSLDGALDSIRRRGGGTVEAYPVTHRGGLAAWFGTVSMFGNRGFEVVAPFGKSNVVMRREI